MHSAKIILSIPDYAVEQNSLRLYLNVSRGRIDLCQLFHIYCLRDETKREAELQTTATALLKDTNDVIMDPACTETDIAQNYIEIERAAAITYHSMNNKLVRLYRMVSILGPSHVQMAHNKFY